MTKSGRRALFLLVATVANLLITCLILVILLLGWSGLSRLLAIPQDAFQYAFMASFLIAIVASGLIYSRVLKYLSDKPELVERFGLARK